MIEPLHYLTIAEAADRIRSGHLSPVTLVQACLDRIADLDPKLHAFITLTAEDALAQARTAQAEIAAGRYRGPLHGIPIAHKDIVCTRGLRTTAHSDQLRDWVPDADATVYTRLKDAGAIALGKLSLWEFAYGNPSESAAFPPARNPWNVDYSPGGSSSGSGAAVSAGLCFGATGTDTGGSIRHPASVCSIVGMKPTFGRVSVHGVLPLAASLDHVGPMTRTVRDNALMLQAMAGYDPKDAASANAPVPDYGASLAAGVKGMKLAVPRRFIASNPHDAECIWSFEEALRVLRDLGAETLDFDFPEIGLAADLGTRILLAEAHAYHRENLQHRPEKFDRSLRERLLAATAITDAELQEAQEIRAALVRKYTELFASGVDAIVSVGRESISDTMDVLMASPGARRGGCTRMYNLSGMPALVLPMGFGAHGLPLGLQIASDWFCEERIYRIAAAYEAASGWAARHPPI
ncbi:MAG: Asp-tRNA(Asn)/Glu-tRNA(Gln) amidotransferase subunit GatA [Gammaproteobacteria bacterium]|nr:Asp-tRNA(Asn)/Glu-tRNA(Gln) amidotransferase subunit GatA [Gammaproteobacteria bacterium]